MTLAQHYSSQLSRLSTLSLSGDGKTPRLMAETGNHSKLELLSHRENATVSELP